MMREKCCLGVIFLIPFSFLALGIYSQNIDDKKYQSIFSIVEFSLIVALLGGVCYVARESFSLQNPKKSSAKAETVLSFSGVDSTSLTTPLMPGRQVTSYGSINTL